jgi:hypothetical protein
MFVALKQEHLGVGRKLTLRGSIKHAELVPHVKLRVNVRMQIELDLPAVRLCLADYLPFGSEYRYSIS